MSDITLTLAAPCQRRERQGLDIVSRVRSAWVAAHQRRLLAEMDNRTLADIGASRAEVVWEDNRPISERIDTLR